MCFTVLSIFTNQKLRIFCVVIYRARSTPDGCWIWVERRIVFRLQAVVLLSLCPSCAREVNYVNWKTKRLPAFFLGRGFDSRYIQYAPQDCADKYIKWSSFEDTHLVNLELHWMFVFVNTNKPGAIIRERRLLIRNIIFTVCLVSQLWILKKTEIWFLNFVLGHLS